MTLLSTLDELALLEHFQEVHGVELELGELRSLQAYLYEISRTERNHRLVPGEIVPDDIQNLPVAVAVVGGSLGGFFAGSLGVSTIAGILIGASLFSKLFDLFNRPKQEEEPTRAYGFDSVVNLVPLSGAIPLFWCNRDVNPNGGVRASGFLLHARVETFKGSQRYFGLQAFGYGRIGEIDESELLIDDQPLDNFFDGDIEQYIRLGTADQTAIAEFPFYSQAISPNTNTSLGVDLRGEAKRINSTTRETAVTGTPVGGFLASVNPTRLVKNTGLEAVLTSDQQILRDDGWVQGQVLSNDRLLKLGLFINNSLRFHIQIQDNGHYAVVEDGAVVFLSGTPPLPATYLVNDVFRVEYQSGTLLYRKNGNVVYTSTQLPVYPARLQVQILDSAVSANGTSFNDLKLADVEIDELGNVQPVTGSTTIRVDEEDVEKFTPSDRYRVNGVDFSIIDKEENTLTIDKPITVGGNDEIYAVYTAKFENTQSVSRVDFNFVFSLWGRDDKGKLKRHAIAFDIFIKKATSATLSDQPPSFTRLYRIFVANKNQGEIRRSLKIKNLPFGKYQFEFRSLERVSGGFPILRLSDGGALADTPTGVIIDGKQIIIETEFASAPSESSANKDLSFDGKDQVSSESAPPGRITSLNETTLPADLGHSRVSRYPKLSLLGLKAIASERLNGTPTPSALIQRGRIGWLLLSAGEATPASTPTQLVYFGEDFLSFGIQAGNKIRNLDKKLEDAIVSVTSNTITTTLDLNWEQGDRFVVYVEGSTCYFPDVLADGIRSPDGGLSELVDADQVIDYFSFVKSKRFCIRNGFFCDITLSEQTNIIEWAEREAPLSLLFASSVDGRMALIPEEYEPPAATFTDSVMESYNETLLQPKEFNQVTVRFKDGSDTRFREKTVTIATQEAFNGLEPIYEAPTIDAMSSVSNPAQAERIGQMFLQSSRFQDRGINFTTGLQGLGIKPGSLVVGASVITQIHAERSGFITAVEAYDENMRSQVVKLSQPVEEGLDGSYSASIYYIDGTTNQSSVPVDTVDRDGETWLLLSELNAPVSPPSLNRTGDYLAVGKDSELRRVFRVAGIEIQSEFKCTVAATRWDRRMLGGEGLVTIF
jgi:hypothetical protein